MPRLSNVHTITIGTPATQLQALAQNMPSGSWAQMGTTLPQFANTPAGLSKFTGQGGATGLATGNFSKLAYDPARKQLHFLGGDHMSSPSTHQFNHLIYNETNAGGATPNAWVDMAQPPWGAYLSFKYHGYEHSAFDTVNGLLRHRTHSTSGFYTWNPATQTWSGPTSALSQFGYTTPSVGFEFFPDRNSLIQFQTASSPPNVGKVAEYNVLTNTWADLSGETLSGSGDPDNIARYSAPRQLVYVGGGDGSQKLWTVRLNGSVVSEVDFPTLAWTIGPNNKPPGATCCAVNPITGDLLMLAGANNFQSYSPTTRLWTALPSPTICAANLFEGGPSAFGIGSVTIFQYGVVCWIKAFVADQPAQMWLWKP